MNGHSVEAIFFDFGGVLQTHMDGIDHKVIEARLGLPEKTLMRILYRDSRYMEYQVAGCTREEWLDSIWKAANEHAGDKAGAVMQAWQEADHPLNQDVMGLARRLQGRYKLGIISNTIPGMEERIRERFPELIELFDVRIGSGDLGVAKPDPAIFLQATREAGVAPERSVFTDDAHPYAEAAKGLGMHGFHFTGYEQFVADLHSIGVEA